MERGCDAKTTVVELEDQLTAAGLSGPWAMDA